MPALVCPSTARKTYFDLLPHEIIMKITFESAKSKPLPRAGYWSKSVSPGQWVKLKIQNEPSVSWNDVRGLAVVTAEGDEKLALFYMKLLFPRHTSSLGLNSCHPIVKEKFGKIPQTATGALMQRANAKKACTGCCTTTTAVCEFTKRRLCASCKMFEKRTRLYPLEVAHSFFSAETLKKDFDIGFRYKTVYYRAKDGVESCPETVLPRWEAPNISPENVRSLDDLVRIFEGSSNTRDMIVKVVRTALRLGEDELYQELAGNLCAEIVIRWYSHITAASKAINAASSGKSANFVKVLEKITANRCLGCSKKTVAKCHWFNVNMCKACHKATCDDMAYDEAAEMYGLMKTRIQARPTCYRVCKGQVEAFAEVAYGVPAASVPGLVENLRQEGATSTATKRKRHEGRTDFAKKARRIR